MWLASAEPDNTSTVTLTVLLICIAAAEPKGYSACACVDETDTSLGPVDALRVDEELEEWRGDEQLDTKGDMMEMIESEGRLSWGIEKTGDEYVLYREIGRALTSNAIQPQIVVRTIYTSSQLRKSALSFKYSCAPLE